MKPDYDVVVIGTGVGGAAAGALLARDGFRVLLLEKNQRIGGACSYYKKDGVLVDVGAHFFSRGDRGPIGEVQRRLGARHRIRFLRCDPLFRLKGPQFDIKGNFRIRSLPALYASMFRQTGVSSREIFSLGGKSVGPLLFPEKAFQAMKPQNIEDYFLSSTGNPSFLLLTSIFMGLYFVLPYWLASVGEAGWCTQQAVHARDPGYPQGGAVAVPKAFLRGAAMHGACVEKNTRVTRILVENGRATGVETADGRSFTARAVVSTTSLKDTVRLAGRESFPPFYRRYIKQMKGSMSAIQLKILLDKPVVKEGIFVGIRDRRASPCTDFTTEDVRRMWENVQAGRVPEIFSFYCPVPTNFDPLLAPAGKQLLTVTSVAPACDRKPVHRPEAWIDALEKAFFEVLPEARNHVVWIDRFSNRFLAQWLGKQGGPVISTAQDTRQVGSLRHPNTTPVQGLFVAGDCAGARGIGTELACQSGIDCTEVITRALGKKNL